MKWTITTLRPTLWRRGGVDIIVTHAPPRFVQDAEDLCHRGFRSFRWLIGKYSPKYFIHGHIHGSFTDPSERVTLINKTKVINTYGHYLLEIHEEQHARTFLRPCCGSTGGSPCQVFIEAQEKEGTFDMRDLGIQKILWKNRWQRGPLPGL